MNDFEAELLELIMDTIREDKDQSEMFLRRDLDMIIRREMKEHDEEVRRETKLLLDEDEAYDEGYDDGYTNGWNDAREEIQELAREMQEPRRS